MWGSKRRGENRTSDNKRRNIESKKWDRSDKRMRHRKREDEE
jgi:hypothetical protein